MRLSKRTEYGLRAAVQLALAYDQGFIQTREVSRRERLPNKFLEAILRVMKDGNIVVSRIGAAGGYRLADRPENISVGRLLRVLEGELIDPDLLKPLPDPANARRGMLGLHLVASIVQDSLAKATDNVSLTKLVDMIAQARGDARQMFYI